MHKYCYVNLYKNSHVFEVSPETMNFATSAKQVNFLIKYFNGELLLKIHNKLSVQA